MNDHCLRASQRIIKIANRMYKKYNWTLLVEGAGGSEADWTAMFDCSV